MKPFRCSLVLMIYLLLSSLPLYAQLIDRSRAPSTSGDGVQKSLTAQIGAGRGDLMTPDSSVFIIARDPFRSIRRGRQLFQRKFSHSDGLGPLNGDGFGNPNVTLAVGAGLGDSCASCHGRPRGSAGFGGDVATRPDSRDAPHLFGLGLKEMLADEMTQDLRQTRALAMQQAAASGREQRQPLQSKSVQFGELIARPDGTLDTSLVKGVDADLRVRPFFAHGGTISIREFIVGALNDEMGLQSVDEELSTAKAGAHMVTPSGMVLDGRLDQLNAPPAASAAQDPDGDGIRHEVPVSLVDHLEFYLLNYFKPGSYRSTARSKLGRQLFTAVQCTGCHIADLTINRDRRVADVETTFDAARGGFNHLYATASPLFQAATDTTGFASLKWPQQNSFVVRDIFTDFKRHDLGPNFYERQYDGQLRREFLTTALWGVGSTSPYGHDGRSINLHEVILRHGGEAQTARDAYAQLSERQQTAVQEFLNTLIIFPPDDTPSNLKPEQPSTPGYPQKGHGAIALNVLFNDPNDLE
jgi:hypothetical protein